MEKTSGAEILHLPNKPGAFVEMQITQRSKYFRGPTKVIIEKKLFAANPEELKKLMDKNKEMAEKRNTELKGDVIFVHFGAIHELDKVTGEYRKIDAISAGVRNAIVATGRALNSITEGHWPSK